MPKLVKDEMKFKNTKKNLFLENNKKEQKIRKYANLYVQCSYKNTIFNLIDSENKAYKQWSTKSLKKINNSKKNIAYNVKHLVYLINKFLFLNKINFLRIFFKGKGVGRYNVIRNIYKKKFKIISISDYTSVPFNGCRNSKKKRR